MVYAPIINAVIKLWFVTYQNIEITIGTIGKNDFVKAEPTERWRPKTLNTEPHDFYSTVLRKKSL